jgi:hypothetical protein
VVGSPPDVTPPVEASDPGPEARPAIRSIRDRERALVAGRDPLLRLVLVRFDLSPTILAGVVSGIGFLLLSVLNGVLGLLGENGGPTGGLPWVLWVFFGGQGTAFRGIFSYFAPTIGDGVLLPVAAAMTLLAYRALYRLMDELPPETGQRGKLIHDLARVSPHWPWIVGVATSAIVSALWVFNPNTVPNWTIQPGVLFFSGWYHAAFLALMLWWFMAFGARMWVASRWVFRQMATPASADKPVQQSHESAVIDSAVRVWGAISGVVALLTGFTVLMYVDNYGTALSLQSLTTSVTTMGLLGGTAAVAAATPAAWTRGFFTALRKRDESVKRRGPHAIAWIPLGATALLAVVLLSMTTLLPQVAPWMVAAILAGVLVPLLVLEECVADTYWVEGIEPDGVGLLAMVALSFFVSAGLLASLVSLMSATAGLTTMNSMVRPFMISMLASLAVFAVALAGVAVVGRVASGTRTEALGERPKPHPPFFDISKNLAMYWVLFQLGVVPVSLLVYRLLGPIAVKHTSELVSLLWAFSGAIGVSVMFPLRNDITQIRDLEMNRAAHPTFDEISAHIMFQIVGTAVVAMALVLWMWVAALRYLM